MKERNRIILKFSIPGNIIGLIFGRQAAAFPLEPPSLPDNDQNNLREANFGSYVPSHGETSDSELTKGDLPAPVEIEKFKIDAQDYPISCEAAVLSMAVRYLSTYFSLKPLNENLEQQLIDMIPRHSNPHRGFRGEINQPQSFQNYGVYAEPLQEVLAKLGIPSSVEYGGFPSPYDSIAEAVRNGFPVVVWISSHNNSYPVKEIDPETGEEYSLLLGEHTVLVIGVEGWGANKRFLVLDPLPQGKGSRYWTSDFKGWSAFGREGKGGFMRLVIGRRQFGGKSLIDKMERIE